MFKVVMISPLPPESAGESIYTASLIDKLGVNKNTRIYAIAGLGASELPTKSGRVTTMNIWQGRSILYPFKLLKAIRKIRPHIVHVQFGPHGDVYGGVFGEPMILLLLLLRLVGINTTITLHSTWMTDQVEERFSIYPRIGKFSFIAKTVFRLFMKLLQIGTTKIQLSTVRTDSLLKRKFTQEYNIPDRDVYEIPHPCKFVTNNIKSEEALRQLGLDSKLVLLMFGYIRWGKGFEVALAALSRVKREFPDVLLLIAGKAQDSESKTYLRELKRKCKEFGLEEFVRFDSHYIPEEMIPIYFSAARIILVSYTESVGASGPIHNYAGYGKPIIAADVGYHMKETLGGTLTLFRNRDFEDLADKIILLLSDPELQKELGDRQIRYATNESWDVAAKRTMRNYKRTIIRK